MTPASAPRTSPPGTVARAIRLLVAVVDADGPATVQYLAERVDLAPSTTHRLLALLAEEGMVAHDPVRRTYSVGAEAYRMAARTVASVGLDAIVAPLLNALATRFDESVLFGLYSPATATLAFIGRADGDHSLQYRIEMNTPTSLVRGASGKAVTAHLDPAAVEAAVAAELRQAADPAAVPTAADLGPTLQQIRTQGYAESSGEKLPEARGVAVPVFGPAGVAGSLTLTHPKDRMPHGELDDIVSGLKEAADQIGRYLGREKDGRR